MFCRLKNVASLLRVTHILGNDIEKEVASTVAKMYRPLVPLPLTPKDGGAGYPRPVQDSPYPKGGVDNSRQLRFSGVSTVAVLGTLPETASSPP